MCIGLVLDTLVIMVLAKLISGKDIEEDWIKPLIVAVFAGAGSAAAMTAAPSFENYILLFIGGILLLITALVTIGCWLLLDIEFGKSALIGCGYLFYKVVFIGLMVFLGYLNAISS